MDNAPSGFNQGNMAWDIRKQAYVWEDPVSDALFVWDSTKEQWILDETSFDPSEGVDGPGEPYNPDESYDPEEGSEQIQGKRPQKQKEAEKPKKKKKASNDPGSTEKPKKTDSNDPGSAEKPKKTDSDDPGSAVPPQKEAEENSKDEKKKKRKRKGKKKKPNCTVYITGLPKDVTEEEFINFCKTAGIIAKDPVTLQPKIRIYRDDSGIPKGDGLVTYLKVLSIPNAFQLLDGFDFRPPENHVVKLELVSTLHLFVFVHQEHA